MTRQKIQLLIIDPQNDFCDLPQDWWPLDLVSGQRTAPALPVTGAHADLQRVAALVRAGGQGIGQITVTLDSHHRIDIAHPGFWQQGDGSAVAPFTPITAQQVRAGEFAPRDPAVLPRTLSYLNELEARGRYTLMVWPVHCEIGTWGHNLHADLKAALGDWETTQLTQLNLVLKGSNPWTEHYSAMQAEVPDGTDPATELNRTLLAELAQADLLLIAGQASSHCVKATTEHIVAHLPAEAATRVMLLTDAMSPVGGFEANAQGFLADMRSRGVQLATCDQALPLLTANFQ